MFELFPALTACEAQTPVPKNRSQQTSLSDRVSCFVRGVMILYHPDVEILLAEVFGRQGHAVSHCIGIEELYKNQGRKEKQKLQKKRRRKKVPDGCEIFKQFL